MSYFSRNLFERILGAKVASISIIMMLTIIVFSCLSSSFLTLRNFSTIMESLPEIGIVTLGVAMLMISGEFDLSVGSVFALSPIIVIVALSAGWPSWLSVVLALVFCSIIGLIHGNIVLRAGIPSFITTLAGMMIWRGIVLVLTKGFPPHMPESAHSIAYALAKHLGPFRVSFFYFLALTLILWILLERTRFGNRVFAVGGNRQAAYRRGVMTDRIKLICFTLVSVLAGLGGMIQAFRIKSALPSAGSQYELSAIAGAVIGGVGLFGGKGSVVGAAIGALLMRIIENGLVHAGAPGYWFRLFVGVVIVIAVTFNILIERFSKKIG